MATKSQTPATEVVKKPRAPRKPKVQVEEAAPVTVIETPTKKPRAPRKPKVQVEEVKVIEVKSSSPEIKDEISISVEKAIAGMKSESPKPKERGIWIEIAIGVALALGAYGLGYMINSERIQQVENNQTSESISK